MNQAACRLTLQKAFELAVSFLDGLDRKPVSEVVDLADLRNRLGRPLADKPSPPDSVIAELARDVDGGIVRSAGGRFFGWVIGGGLPAAIAADWLTSVWDQNAVLYRGGTGGGGRRGGGGEVDQGNPGAPCGCRLCAGYGHADGAFHVPGRGTPRGSGALWLGRGTEGLVRSSTDSDFV
jgi:hypothetical protein